MAASDTVHIVKMYTADTADTADTVRTVNAVIVHTVDMVNAAPAFADDKAESVVVVVARFVADTAHFANIVSHVTVNDPWIQF